MLSPTGGIHPFPLRKEKAPKDEPKDSTGGNICFDRRSLRTRPEEYFSLTGGGHRLPTVKTVLTS